MNYIRKIWCGNGRLADVFWGHLVIIQLALYIVMIIANKAPEIIDVTVVLLEFLVDLFVLPWLFVGIWRSSRRESRVWKWLSRVAAILICSSLLLLSLFWLTSLGLGALTGHGLPIAFATQSTYNDAIGSLSHEPSIVR